MSGAQEILILAIGSIYLCSVRFACEVLHSIFLKVQFLEACLLRVITSGSVGRGLGTSRVWVWLCGLWLSSSGQAKNFRAWNLVLPDHAECLCSIPKGLQLRVLHSNS